MGIHNQNLAAANWAYEQSRATAAAQQHAVISANRLNLFLFSEDENYLVEGEYSTSSDELDLMEAVAYHYEIRPEADQAKPFTVSMPKNELRDALAPEVNVQQFTISMSPFFIEGFRIVKRKHTEEPFVGSFILKDRLEYSSEMKRIVLERSAVTRFLKSPTGTDIKIPSTTEVSAVRDFIHAGYVLDTGLVR